MRKLYAVVVAVIGSAALMASANAALHYDVSDTSVVNCSGAPHGLWTNSDIGGGSCSNYFSISGSFTFFNDDSNSDNWYGTLDASAENPQGIMADIDLMFSGFEDAWGSYKQEGGAPYDPATMDFFTSINGVIEIDNTVYDIDNFVGDYAFQFGEGANAKDPNEFGASAWIQSCGEDPNDYTCMSSHHWDLNLTFTPVSEPASVLLLCLGLLGLGLTRRSSQR